MAILERPGFPGGLIHAKDARPDTQSIYDESITQQFALGTKMIFDDSRVFRYAKNGGVALTRALMCQSAVEESKFVAIAQTGYAQVVGTVDITVLVTTGSSAAENALANGTMVANKVSPTTVGDTYHIIASKLRAADDTAMDLKLEWPGIRNAIAATGELSLAYSPWYNLVVHPVTTATSCAAGVPLIDVTINYYFWAQTGGPCPLVVDTGDTIVIGAPVGVPGTNAVAGACGARQSTRIEWGRTMSIATGDEPALIYLTLDS
jgi:hypothetical protein